MNKSELIKGYSPSESEKIRTHLERLLPHLTPEKFVIVGGLAIRYGLISKGVEYPKRPFNDLDLIAESENVVYPSIKNDFQIYHHHRDGNTFFLAFVDPISKTKVDIFDWSKPPFYKEAVDFKGRKLLVQSLEDQLTVTVLDILQASNEIKRDPKMVSDMELMLLVADLNKANNIWQKRGQKSSFSEAVENVRRLFKEHPEFFKEKPWHKPGPYKCPNCINTKDFPLTPMEEVYKVLGYVE
ncbi:MAG: hypothetical protein COU25_01825 [Candidatus Levybacteria bacterium CG10_big_fil_rev_8_21_14_0_10_35_13]|nr:MAG: hypothetical protein COU25_01825 [Candidatus Levybacteria bacterium CG10_big_fil_rev_8_21_14_0_10_35_13]